MGHWNFRLVKHTQKCWDDTPLAPGVAVYAIHEVYYNDEGQAWGRTTNPISLTTDQSEVDDTGKSAEEIIAGELGMMLRDLMRHPTLEEPYEWASSGFDELDEDLTTEDIERMIADGTLTDVGELLDELREGKQDE